MKKLSSIAICLAVFSTFALESTVLWDEWYFSFNGGPEKPVTVPHDAAIEHDFDVKNYSTRCGALPYHGRFEYRRNLYLESAQGYRLEFDGIMSNSKVYLNGKLIYERPHGYASFVVDLADAAQKGLNELRVVAEPWKDSSRWYPGAGLYREVRLVKVPDDHVVPGSMAIWAEKVEKSAAKMVAKWIMSRSGAQEKHWQVANPLLWSPEAPNLYTITLGGEDFRYGIRKLEFSAEKGFFLNDKHRKLHGVCMHHDLGVFGAAFVKEAARRQLSILKEMGCDAIRTSHNFPAPGLLELCDEIGIMVMAEAFDEWKSPKVKNGMAKIWEKWHAQEVENFVRSARNHPCIVMWSAGNELIEDLPDKNLTEQGIAIGKELTAIFHKFDPQQRPVTAAHWTDNTITNGIATATDIFGANYLPKHYADFRGKQCVVGTETCATISSRGSFFLPIDGAGKYAITNEVCDFGLVPMHYNDYPPDEEFAAQDANEYVLGEFVWSGFDYLGEPDPWGKTARSSYFGIFDLCGFAKSRYWLYKTQWRPEERVAHIVPHWNWQAGDKIPVHVFTSGDEAELFVNDRSMGRRVKGKNQYRLIWEVVPWEAGELRVVARRNGKVWAEDKVVTVGEFARFAFHDEVWGEYIFRTAKALDVNGNFVPKAAIKVPIDEPTGYKFFGACNGDAANYSSLHSHAAAITFNGMALIVFKRQSAK